MNFSELAILPQVRIYFCVLRTATSRQAMLKIGIIIIVHASVLVPYVFISPSHSPCFIDTDWSSEYSSGTEDLLSGSRETSVRESRSRSMSIRHEGNRERRGRSSGENTLTDLNCEQTRGWLVEGEEGVHRKSNQKSSESPAAAWQGAVEEEE